MDEFSYLSVLIAVILGLAITQILQGLRALGHARGHVVLYWPSLVWAGLVALIAVQSWWAMFGLRVQQHWSFLAFMVVLLENSCIYMLAALVLPDIPEERHVDLRETYFRQSHWFYGFMAGALVLSLCKDLVISGGLPQGWNLGFHIFSIAGAIVMACTRHEPFHKAYTAFSVVLFVTYIVLLFGYLH